VVSFSGRIISGRFRAHYGLTNTTTGFSCHLLWYTLRETEIQIEKVRKRERERDRQTDGVKKCRSVRVDEEWERKEGKANTDF